MRLALSLLFFVPAGILSGAFVALDNPSNTPIIMVIGGGLLGFFMGCIFGGVNLHGGR
jgi:hypothetical protein